VDFGLERVDLPLLNLYERDKLFSFGVRPVVHRCTVRDMNIFATFLVTLFFGVVVDAEKNSIDNQRMSCRPGQAISDIWWSEEKNGRYKTYSIACANITDSCEEKCQWTEACETRRYGDGCYVRGINALFDNGKDGQSLLFLCCNSSKSISKRCNGKLDKLGGKPRANDLSATVFRQAKSNYGEPDDSSAIIFAETCTVDKSNTTLCPLHQTKSDSSMDPRLYGLAGLAGLAGLSGIALIKKKKDNAPPCCCTIPGDSCVDSCNICTGSSLLCIGDTCT